MRAKGAAATERRSELMRALNRMSREASGLGVLFGEEVARRMGINHTDLECLDVIGLRERVTAGEIAEASGLTTGAVTGVIDRLEKAGFVKRERDPGDRRKVYVRLLPRALSEGGKYYRPFEEAVMRLVEAYSDKDLALLLDYFTRTRDLISAELARLREKDRSRKPGRSPG
jgi:DNA-binding MarR family transcriptional regulator